MNTISKGQPHSVAKTEPTPTSPITTNVEKNDSTKKEGQASSTEFDPDTLASVELLVEQASKAEPQALKFMVSSGIVQFYQGRLISKAKRILKAKAKSEEVMEVAMVRIYASFNLGKAAMNRRAQLWDEAVYQEVISLDLQKKIGNATELTPELFTAMEAELGSVTGTDLMRKLGILPAKVETKSKTVKSATARLKDKTKLVETLLKEIKLLLDGGELKKEISDTRILESFNKAYAQCQSGFSMFKPLDDLTFPDLPEMPEFPSGLIISSPRP